MAVEGGRKVVGGRKGDDYYHSPPCVNQGVYTTGSYQLII